MTIPRSIAAWRRPVISTSRTTIAATIHAGTTCWPTSMTSAREHEHLVRDRIEERAERRRPPVPAREPAVEPVGRHGHAENRGRPVRMIVERPREEDDDDRDGEGPRDGQLVRGAHNGDNTARRCSTRSWSPTAGRSPSASSGRCASSASASVAVYAEPDRGSLHVDVRGRGVPHGRPASRATSRWTRSSRPRCAPALRRFTRATASSPRTPAFARAVAGRRARVDRAAAGGDRADGGEDPRAHGDAGGGRPDHPGHDRAGASRSRSCSRSASRSATRC